MMFKINRLKIIVKTEHGTFGFDNAFHKRINFIASYDNTRGKSSCIEAIYYCLGLEELIGGKNEQALRPVFRKSLEYSGKQEKVLESEFYLEVQNSRLDTITIYRTANKENYSSSLISVYYGDLEKVLTKGVISEDMYIHHAGAATNKKGFHRYLETFLGWELPSVPTYDEVDRKLYIQTVFSALLIEQKRGWSDILASTPTIFRIKDVRQRVIEFLIGLKTLETERKKQKCKTEENRIKTSWETLYKEILSLLASKRCYIQGLPRQPEILNSNYNDRITILKQIQDEVDFSLEAYIEKVQNNINLIQTSQMRVGDNIEDLQEELSCSKEKIEELEILIENEQEGLVYEKSSVETLRRSLEIINKDLQNNKDALKIKKLGSTQDWLVNKDICPTCRQKIHDALLPQDVDYNLMSVEENIKHLESQKAMIEFGLKGRKNNINVINSNIQELEANLLGLRRIVRSLINDIYTTDNSIVESSIHKKVMLENEVEELVSLKNLTREKLVAFKGLSEDWQKLISNKRNLPKDRFTIEDIKCLNLFQAHLRSNLKNYGYTSINLNEVEISKDKLLPTIEGFDMKFDSSASDNVRAIWAFTTALLQTSINCEGEHPRILIFDEPDQQSIVLKDMENFLKSIADIDCQVIIGITLKDEDTKNVLKRLDDGIYKLTVIREKALTPLTVSDSKTTGT